MITKTICSRCGGETDVVFTITGHVVVTIKTEKYPATGGAFPVVHDEHLCANCAIGFIRNGDTDADINGRMA